MKNWIFIIIALIMTSCSREQRQESPKLNPPQADLTTPDNALKSYWSFQIWQDTTFLMDTSHLLFYSTRVRKELAQKYAKENSELKAAPFRLRNNIDKVNIESESRAIVMTKERYYQNSENYDERKYVLVKEQSAWLVDDILKLCWNCKGEGKALDILHEYPYTQIKKTCEYCGGLGWIKLLSPK